MIVILKYPGSALLLVLAGGDVFPLPVSYNNLTKNFIT